ncbi:MAG TPA: amidase family protein, partial [Chitinophagaceae bacterium]|nr:amidase family protein [Chitinophagaceae bacterium]
MFEYTSIDKYHLALTQGETSCIETVRHYLSKIENKKHLNAFIHVFEDEALKKAAEFDTKRRSGKPIGKLHGVVVAIKDVICYKDHGLSAASAILKDFTSLYSATAIEKLLVEEAIIVGV